MKKCRILVLMHPDLVPPDSIKGWSEEEINVWKTEYDVVSTLRPAHEVKPLGVKNELAPIRDEVESFKPHVVFNLLEEFHGEAVYDHSVVSLPRAAARALHRLQSARPGAGARQGPLEEARALPPRAGSGLRRVSDAAAR